MKKTISIILCIVSIIAFAGCSDLGTGASKDIVIPENSIVLEIEKQSNGKFFRGFGAECDPLFLSENVGEKGEENGLPWEVKAEDWNEYIAPRIEEMNLQTIRVMLCPSYFCPNYENYPNNYTWGSEQMNSLYQVLDTAQELDIFVNITYWGVDALKVPWLAKTHEGWMSLPKPEYEDMFAAMCADAVKYLKERRGYTCIQEVTIFNEPNSYGFDNYERICRLVYNKFVESEIRDSVEFNLADSAANKSWIGQTANRMSDLSDLLNGHTYDYGYNMSNAEILNELKDWVSQTGDSGLDLFFNEFGTNKATTSHNASDNLDPERGLEICRIAANMLNAGVVGADYWVLFSQVYNREEKGRYMDMGLWGIANENYACRPVYYAYSLLTRFAPRGAKIYPIELVDDNIVAFAVKTISGKWSYFAINNSNSNKKLAFVNKSADKISDDFKKYVYDVKAVPNDNRVITSFTNLKGERNHFFDTVTPMTVTVYTQI